MIHEDRIRLLGRGAAANQHYVIYWMQSALRPWCNHALEFAVQQANNFKLPLVVYYGIADDLPEMTARSCRFLLEGLKETAEILEERGMNMVIRMESPVHGFTELVKNAELAVFDMWYPAEHFEQQKYAASLAPCPILQIESNIIVPVETASPKEEYSAATLRPGIQRNLKTFLHPLRTYELKNKTRLDLPGLKPEELSGIMDNLKLDHTAFPVDRFHTGGPGAAEKLLDEFIEKKLDSYPEKHNNPVLDFSSGLSPYLRFGNISPLHIALKVKESGSPGAKDFLEELIIRRELAINFVYYNNKYDKYSALPEWARESLKQHIKDKREYVYSLNELENAQTHDPYWNAAQKEMLITGKMHGYMRMYWGKKILEWSSSPQQAFADALFLNNKYELDGGDPNGYAGVAWCFGKHDRPWRERNIFGKVRYMNAAGLERKFDIGAYVKKIAGLEKAAKACQA